MSLSTAVTQHTRPMKPFQRFEGHTRWIWGVIHLTDGQRMITCSDDGSLRVWNLQTRKQIANWRDGESAVRNIALSLDGKKVVSGSVDGVVRLWNTDTGKVIAKWMGHAQNVRSVCWNRDGERVLSGYSDGTARVWDVENGKTILEIETGLSEIWAAIYSPNTTMIAIGGDSGEDEFIKILDANTGKLVTNLKGHTWSVFCLAWTADGKTLISGSNDSSIRTWNTTTWQQIAIFSGHTKSVYAIAISPNSCILASASLDRTVRLWNLVNGQSIGSPLQHALPVSCVSFSTDGSLLATGCRDKNACSWDISAIVRETSLYPSNGGGNPLHDASADALRHQRQRRENARRPHPGFSDDYPHPSTTLPISPSSAHRDMPLRPHFLEWARNPWLRGRNDEGIELQKRLPMEVDTPFAQIKHMNYSARQAHIKKEREKEEAKKKEKEKARSVKNAKKASPSSSLPPKSDVTQKSAVVLQVQPSELPVGSAVPTMSITPAAAAHTATTSATSLPSAIIPRSRYWTHFTCCTSAQDANGHH